jgi:NAD(P)-dependent dehydrogenase (short-subunit alcohol dehydrogenase family)
MKTILITGANRGLGLEMARQYLQAGWQVMACCRSPQSAAELNTLAASSEGRLRIFDLDVKQVEEILRFPSRLQDQPIDILVNNAGILKPFDGNLDSASAEAWLESFQVNTIAAALMAKSLVEQICAGQSKIIANITSTVGSISLASDTKYLFYGASKAALNYVSKSMAIDLKPRGITVVAIHPGWVKTDMGGANALLTAEESVAGIRKVLDTIGLEQSGVFCNYKGEVIPY